MKTHPLYLLGLALLFPNEAFAGGGSLYGTVRTGTAPAAGVELSVACPGFSRSSRSPSQVVTVVTDSRGSFALRAQSSGRCEMRARRDNRIGDPFEVFVSNNPVRFDLQIDSKMNRVR
jgi:hypothetical protein